MGSDSEQTTRGGAPGQPADRLAVLTDRVATRGAADAHRGEGANISDARLKTGRAEWLAIAGVAAMMALVQSGSPGLSGNDSYYHVKMAEMLPAWGFVQAFPWLHWTIFRDAFVSHHHGFHVLLAPLVWLSDRITGGPILGGKVMTVVCMAATAALLAAALRALGVRHRAAWVLLLAVVPWHFWLRMSYVRAPIVALPLMLGAVVLILRQRPIALGVLAFVFTQVYGGAVIFPILPLAFVAAAIWTGEGVRPAVVSAIASGIGLAAGLVLNPYFPGNLGFLKTQVVDTGLGAPAEVGNEWRSYDAIFLLQISGGLIVLWGAALLYRLRSGRAIDGRGIAVLLLNAAFLALTIKARRFVEYWPVFALLDAACLAGRNLDVDLFDAGFGPARWPRLREALGVVVGASAIAYAAVILGVTRNAAKPDLEVDVLREAMAYLKSSTPAGALVLTDDWDAFPECFFFNTHNHYAVGLDPVFTQVRYPDVWERYRVITRGEAPARMTTKTEGPEKATLDDISGVFHADYVLVARDHPALYRQLTAADDRFVRVWPEAGAAGAGQPAFAVFRVQVVAR